MKQVQFQRQGQSKAAANCVEIADVGSPASWEVVVDIEAFPIHSAEVALFSGRHATHAKWASSLGNEAVGRVSAIGQAVRTVNVGDRVILLTNHQWSERLKVPATAVHRVSMDAELLQQSMLRNSPATAYLMMRSAAELRPGDWIIQTAPLSSVGQCILQLAKIFGIGTINMVGDSQESEAVLQLGGDIVLNLGPNAAWQVKAAKGDEPLRFAFDPVAGPGTQLLAECLDEGGQIINYGTLSTEPCSLTSEQTVYRGISLRGFCLPKMLHRMSFHHRSDLLQKLDEWMTSGLLKLIVDSTFPMEEIESALARAAHPDCKGKVILTTGHIAASEGLSHLASTQEQPQ